MWMISCLNLKRIFLGELFCWGGGWYGLVGYLLQLKTCQYRLRVFGSLILDLGPLNLGYLSLI